LLKRLFTLSLARILQNGKSLSGQKKSSTVSVAAKALLLKEMGIFREYWAEENAGK